MFLLAFSDNFYGRCMTTENGSQVFFFLDSQFMQPDNIVLVRIRLLF